MIDLLPKPVAGWVDGQPGMTVDLSDRGVQFGDGLFEVMAVSDGRVRLQDYHLQRLADGCKRLQIAPPRKSVLKREIGNAIGNESRCIIKLAVTRSGGDLPSARQQPTRILTRHPWPEHPPEWAQQGIHARLCQIHMSPNRALAGLKHLNRLEWTLARLEWRDMDAVQEGIVVDREGAVVGGTLSNIFVWLSHGVLATPGLRLCGVAGVMRRHLLQCAEGAGIQLRVATVQLVELMHAEEIFVCNAVIGVWPVAAIGHWKFPVGPITRQAQAWAATEPSASTA